MKTPALLLLATAAGLAACGSSSANTTSTGNGAAATSSSAAATPTATAAGLAVNTAAVSGVGTVLVDASGHTLYRFTPDAAGQTACTGQCAANWPPAVLPAGEQVVPAASLTGKFATMQRPDGSVQVTYNGWPLYAFVGDTAAGTATGQGKLGKWFAVTPDVAPPGTAASPTM